MSGAPASAQAIPDCTWIDCVPPQERAPLKLKWPPPVCLSCPDSFREVFERYIRTERVGLVGAGTAGALNGELDLGLAERLSVRP